MAVERPRMALRVGITGHRKLEFSEELRARLRAVLEMLQAITREVLRDSRMAYTEGAVFFRATSPLAEGADRLFAKEAVALGFELGCPLPFSGVEYEKDFATLESVEEFRQLLERANGRVLELDGPTRNDNRAAAYESVGRVVIDQVDVLVAIWNGEPAQGAGGTAQIVEIARRNGTLILWINPKSHSTVLKTRKAEVPLSENALREQLTRILKPPESKDPDVTGTCRGKIPERPAALSHCWDAFVSIMTFGLNLSAPHLELPLKGPFVQYYKHFDALANRLAGQYRGAYVASATLAVCAVFLALLSFTLPEHSGTWLLLELAAVVLVYVLTFSVSRREWHYRSVDCRYVAEQFRVLCSVYPLALPAPQPRMPAHHQHGDVAKSWMEWLLRSAIRAAPMPAVKVSPSFVHEARRELLDGWILSQITYHLRNSQKMACLCARSDLAIQVSVFIAAASCAAHFLVHDHEVAKWFTMAAAGFPAVAAAFHAVATQGEFRRLSSRSGDMRESLEKIKARLIALGDTPSFPDLRRIAHDAADLMVEEVADWQILYRKPVEPS